MPGQLSTGNRSPIAAPVPAIPGWADDHYLASLPGLPAPQSFGEARAQSEEQLALEGAQARPAYFNRHTFFFVPMQHLRLLLGAAALMAVISGLVTR